MTLIEKKVATVGVILSRCTLSDPSFMWFDFNDEAVSDLKKSIYVKGPANEHEKTLAKHRMVKNL